MAEQPGKIALINPDGEKAEEKLPELWRAGNLNFRIATDDDRVAVMPGVTPTPDHGFS